mgnify:CR=1 FL=1
MKSSCLFSLVFLVPSLYLSGAVVEGDRGGSQTVTATLTLGDASKTFSHNNLNEAADDVFFTNTVLLEDLTERNDISGIVDVELGMSANLFRTTDGLTGLDFVQLVGYAISRVEMSGSGTSLDGEELEGTFSSESPGNEGWNEFSVTVGPEVATMTAVLKSEEDAGSQSEVVVQSLDGGQWADVAVYTSESRYNSYRENLLLEPGEYRILTRVPTSGSFGLDSSIFILEEIEYEMTMGLDPIAPAYPEEEEYTHPLVGTELTDSPRLQVLNPAIASEVDLGDGTTEVTFTTNLVSTSFCPWREVVVTVREGGPEVTALNRGIFFLDIDPLATEAPDDTGTIQVANEDLDTVRAAILDGSRLSVSGRELIVFRYPVVLVNEDMVEAQVDDVVNPWFYEDRDGIEPGPFLSEPPAEPGQILIEWEPYYAVPPREVSDIINGGTRWVQNFDKDLPMLVETAELDPGTIPNPPDSWRLSGSHLSFQDIIKHGTVRETVSNPLEGYTRNATEDNNIEVQDFFPIPIYLHVNRLKLDDILKVSGNFNFIPGDFSVEYELENGNPVTFLIRNQYTAEANLLIETANHEEVGGSPVVDASETLFDAPLFTVSLPGGAQITASVDVQVGATANITRSLSVPFVSRYTVDVAAGIKDNQPYYDVDTERVPLKMNDPNLYDSIGADLNLWLSAELDTGLSYPSGTSAVMTFGAKLESNFGLHPLGENWWDMSADLVLTSGFEFDLFLLLPIVDAEHEIARYPLFSYDSGGPLLDGLGSGLRPLSFTLQPEGTNPGLRPLSDPAARWGRSVQSVDRTTPGTYFLAELEGTGDILTGNAAGSTQRLLLFTADGRLKRSLESSNISHFIPIDAVPLPGGGAALLGSRAKQVQIVLVDNDLNIFDQVAFEIDSVLYDNLRIATDGEYAYVLGEYYGDSVWEVALTSIRLDDGTVEWSRAYAIAPDRGLFPGDLTVTSDGNIAVSGTTNANFEEADGLPEGDILPNVTNNGFLAKFDSANGDVIWSTMIAHRGSIPHYNAIAESPTGELTVGGDNSIAVLNDEPTMMLLQFSSTGELLEGLLIGYAGSAKAAGNPDIAGLLDDLPHGGETYYDEILDLAWTEEGLWAAGEMGIYNAGSSLSTGSSGFTIFFSPELHPSRYAVHGGNARDTLERLIVTDNGPVATGTTRSFHPWPNGAEGEADLDSLASQWLLKLPWEGRMDFHRISNGAQPDPDDGPPDTGTFYIYPRVVSGLLNGYFDINQPERDSFREGDPSITGAARPFTVTDLVRTTTSLDISFADASLEDVKALEYVPSTAIRDAVSAAAWYQTDPESDTDGDGFSDDHEIYFGTDPLTADYPIMEILTVDPFVVGVPRTLNASEDLPRILSSPDLIQWDPVTPLSVEVLPLDDFRDQVQLEIPAMDPVDEDARFLTVSGPE